MLGDQAFIQAQLSEGDDFNEDDGFDASAQVENLDIYGSLAAMIRMPVARLDANPKV